jgi:trigger factor
LKIDVKIISPTEREMQFEHAWEDIKDDYRAFEKKFAKDIQLPGFRKGMVPLNIIEKKFGPKINYDFINEKFADYYGKALEEKKLTPVSQPELLDLDFRKGDPLKLKLKFEVMPEWELPGYENKISLEKYQYEITDEDVKESIDRLRQNAAEVRNVDDGAKSGHHILADVKELDSKGNVVNTSEDTRFILGQEPFTGENEKAVLGVKPGETRKISLKAGQEEDGVHTFEIRVKAVEEHILPELNDAFAQTVSPDMETVDALKEKVREELASHWEKQSENRMEEQIADFFIDKLQDVELPKSVVEEQAKNIYEDMKKRYPSAPEMDEKTAVENYRNTAEKSLKWQLVKNKVVGEKDIRVEEEDIKSRIDDMLKGVNEEMRESYEKYYQSPQIKNQLHDDIINRKLLEHLKSSAKIKNKKVSRKARLKETGQ